MKITKLELKNFRNYSKFSLDDFKDINIIIGRNGIGKTSILESIYLCSLARSFKSQYDNTLIKKNEKELKVRVETISEGDRHLKLDYILSLTGKKTKINNVLKKRISDFIFQYKVVLFSPDEIKIIKDAPSIRRNFLNISISQINKNYLRILNKYNVLIKNKNDYLKKLYINSNMDQSYLDILDSKIAEYGYEIYKYRRDYIEKLNSYINKIFKKFKKDDSLFIKYETDFDNKNEEEILKLLKKVRNKEIILGMTKTGVHRDDISFLHNDNDAKEYSSQGIQKLIILSLKLSELEILMKDYYESPILLLDDLFSELDIENQNKIIKNLTKNVQVFISTTDIENVDINIIKKAKIIDLNGKVK